MALALRELVARKCLKEMSTPIEIALLGFFMGELTSAEMDRRLRKCLLETEDSVDARDRRLVKEMEKVRRAQLVRGSLKALA